MYPGIHCLYVFARILHLLWTNFMYIGLNRLCMCTAVEHLRILLNEMVSTT